MAEFRKLARFSKNYTLLKLSTSLWPSWLNIDPRKSTIVMRRSFLGHTVDFKNAWEATERCFTFSHNRKIIRPHIHVLHIIVRALCTSFTQESF